MRIRILPLMVIGKLSNWIACSLFIVGLVFSPTNFADDSQPTEEADQEIKFEVSPKTCVTLRQGQPCFVRIRFNWRLKKAMAVCLYILEGEKITCWNSADTGSIVLTQTLPNTTEYLLVDADGVELNRASVAVSWVYRKKRSKRRWRLF